MCFLGSFTMWAFTTVGGLWGAVLVAGCLLAGGVAVTYAARVLARRRDLGEEVDDLESAAALAGDGALAEADAMLRGIGYHDLVDVAITGTLSRYREEVLDEPDSRFAVHDMYSACMTVASKAPFVGLLGTLDGMRRSFEMIGGPDPTAFTKPASLAVGTSMVGVGVALGLFTLTRLLHAHALERRREDALFDLRVAYRGAMRLLYSSAVVDDATTSR